MTRFVTPRVVARPTSWEPLLCGSSITFLLLLPSAGVRSPEVLAREVCDCGRLLRPPRPGGGRRLRVHVEELRGGSLQHVQGLLHILN